MITRRAFALSRPLASRWQGLTRRSGLPAALKFPPDGWALLLLSIVAVLSRLYANPLYAGEPSSDEYFYGLYATEIARALMRGDVGTVQELSTQTRVIGLEVGALLPVAPMDPLSLGRLLQALFNALTVPLVYGLGRAIGLRMTTSIAAAVLALAQPEPWESAWRFWPDSQAAFLALATVLLAVRVARRPTPLSFMGCLGLLALTFVTKEYVAAATLPALVALGLLAAGEQLIGRRSGRGRWMALAALVSAVAAMSLLIALAGPAALDALRALVPGGPILRTVLTVERLAGQAPAVGERLGDYLVALDGQFGPAQFGTAFVTAWALGGVVVARLAAMVAAARVAGRGPLWEALVWLLALVAWLPGLVFGWALAWEITQSALPLQVLLVVAALAVGPGVPLLERWRAREPDGRRELAALPTRVGTGMLTLGLLFASFLVLRLVIWAAPDLRAAFTPRSFLPAFLPLALLAGLGVAELARLVALVVKGGLPGLSRAAEPVLLAAVLGASLIWLAPTQEHLATDLILGRRADRRGNLTTPEGLRITSLVEAERWLQANLLPTDRVLTSMPRHVAWYARTGLDGYANSVTTGDLAPNWQQRYQKILGLLAQPSEIDYVVDYNLFWRDPSSTEATYWQALYEWLRTQPYLEEAYSRRDPNGRVVFYVFRNHRWAVAPTHLSGSSPQVQSPAS